MRLFTLAIASLLCAPAWAQDPGSLIGAAEEAELHFDLGKSAYTAANYKVALEHMLLSNRLAPNSNVVFNIAACYEALGQTRQAYTTYSVYTRASGATQQLAAAQAALRRLAPSVALVEVTSDPPGATVFVDNVNLGSQGVTPVTLALEPGARTIITQLRGHVGAEDQVTAIIGRRPQVGLELDEIISQIQVSGTPSTARVRNIDRPDDAAVAIGQPLSLPLGSYILEVSASGHAAQQIVVTPIEGTVERYVVNLEETIDENKLRDMFAKATESASDTRIYGYIDAYWEQVANTPAEVVVDDAGNQSVVREANAYEFDVLNAHFMVQGSIAGRYRYFLNLAAPGSGGVGDEPIGVRNAWVEAPIYRDYVGVRFGKLYRRFGLYNEILDAVPTFIGIEAPEMFDKDHLLLTRTTNLMLFGRASVGLNSLEYSIATGNDERNGFSVPLGYDVRYLAAGTVTVGTSGYISGKSAPTVEVGDGSPQGGVINWMAEDSYVVYGGFFEFIGNGPILQTEYWRASHNALRDPDKLASLDALDPFIIPSQRERFFDGDTPIESAKYTVQTAYVRAGYEVPIGSANGNVTPYAQVDFYSNPETLAPKSVGGDNEAGFTDNGQFTKLTAGTVIRPVAPVALKVDGSAHVQQLAGGTEFYPEIRVSLSYLWELNL